MIPAECRARLIELMQEHVKCIESANDYLAEIKTAIAENRIDDLQQSLSGQVLPMAEIERLEGLRHELLTSYGFDSGDDGFKKCIAWCDDDAGQVDALYQQLVQKLLKLQRSIQLNSLLVSKGQERVRGSIGILTGSAVANQAKTYSSQGKTVTDGNRRDIAIA